MKIVCEGTVSWSRIWDPDDFNRTSWSILRFDDSPIQPTTYPIEPGEVLPLEQEDTLVVQVPTGTLDAKLLTEPVLNKHGWMSAKAELAWRGSYQAFVGGCSGGPHWKTDPDPSTPVWTSLSIAPLAWGDYKKLQNLVPGELAGITRQEGLFRALATLRDMGGLRPVADDTDQV